MQVQAVSLFEGNSRQSKELHFPKGLPAFENFTQFFIVSNEEEAPFLWLQSKKQANLAFITIDPFLVLSDYLPDINDDDVSLLKIENEEDVLILSIVNINNQNETTANLLSPIIINWKKYLGKQVILQNHQKYSVRTPLS